MASPPQLLRGIVSVYNPSSIRQIMPAIKIILTLLFLIIVSALALENLGSMEIHYYDFQLQVHSFHITVINGILTAFAVGFFIAWLFGKLEKVKLSGANMCLNRTVRYLEKEVAHLKTSPPANIAVAKSPEKVAN